MAATNDSATRRRPAPGAEHLTTMGAPQRDALVVTLPSALEIRMTRTFSAPRPLVFEAFTKAEHLARWWGLRGHTVVLNEIDARPGGSWRRILREPDGQEFAFHGVFREVVPPERLVSTFIFEGMPEAVVVSTITFEEHGGKTAMTETLLHRTEEERDGHLQSGMEEGSAESLSRLDDLLDVIAGQEFIITRTVNAPRDLVWKAWTEAGHLSQWWGPKGFTTRTVSLDLRPGGLFHYFLTAPNGTELWGRFIYREIVPQERLVYIGSFADKDANAVRHPMAPMWPLEMLSTVTFAEHDGKTTLTLHVGALHATAEERRTFEGGFASMRQGYGGTLDQLDEHLARA